MPLSRLFRRPAVPRATVETLYYALVQRAREPALYADGGVPDSVDGRFDMIALYAALLMRRLAGAPPPAGELSQGLFDVMFQDMDRSLREMGAGDMGVGARVKRMVQGFYGRMASYAAALDAEAGLEEALRRNLYGTVAPSDATVAAMAGHVRDVAAALAATEVARFADGRFEIPAFAVAAADPSR